MGSTYVNNLRLEEMTTGEKSGTWGNITNTNLELVGQALGYGTRAIANASTDNITIADGASDADRSMYLKLTGGGQACTVTLLPNTSSKMWIMENATSYTLTFTQGSGANVAIKAGQTKMIFADGLGSGAVVYELGTVAVQNIQADGTVTVGIDDTGYDVTFFGATTGKKLFWDESEDTLNVAGTTALAGNLSVGVDDTGYDVTLFGATAGKKLLWDESADSLIVTGTTEAAGPLKVTGATPTLTIGDAGAEDAKLVFDGNALDMHVGLDDSADELVIGKGSALGTTAHIITDTNGIVRMPLQCSFGVRLGANVSNVTGDNTRYTIPLNQAEWDVNSDFDLTNNKFVAPVDGTYCFNAGIGVDGLTASHTMLDAFFYDESDNWYQYSLNAANVRNNNSDIYLPLSATLKMAAGTEVVLQIQVYNGAKVVDLFGASYPWTWMTGFLVG